MPLIISDRTEDKTSNSKMSTDKLGVWESCWTKGDTPWQLAEVNSKLLNNMDELIGCGAQNGEVTEKTILVPLCGKSKDLVYLYNKGNHVLV